MHSPLQEKIFNAHFFENKVLRKIYAASALQRKRRVKNNCAVRGVDRLKKKFLTRNFLKAANSAPRKKLALNKNDENEE